MASLARACSVVNIQLIFSPQTPPNGFARQVVVLRQGHQMILTLERQGCIKRTPGAARSIQLMVDPGTLPTLRPAQHQTVRSPVQSH